MFILSLARELHMSPRRLLAEHSSADITEWQAYFKLENDDTEKRKQEATASAGAEQRARKQLRR